MRKESLDILAINGHKIMGIAEQRLEKVRMELNVAYKVVKGHEPEVSPALKGKKMCNGGCSIRLMTLKIYFVKF